MHFVCADDAHGAPIMIAAEKAGKTPQAVRRRDRRRPHGSTSTASTSASTTGIRPTRPENPELAQDIYRALRDARADRRRAPIEQFYDPVKGMFLPDRYIKGECPKCGAKDQYGDSCEVCGAVYAPTELKNPYSTLYRRDAGAARRREHYFFQLSRPALRRLPRGLDAGDGTLQPEVRQQGRSEWLGRRAATAAWPTGTSRATRPTSASRFRTRRASTSTSGSTRRSATSPR